MSTHISNVRAKPDRALVEIADYATGYKITSKDALDTARYCLIDTLGCGFEPLSYPACTKLLGPIVPGTVVPNGAKVPGTSLMLKAPFALGRASTCDLPSGTSIALSHRPCLLLRPYRRQQPASRRLD